MNSRYPYNVIDNANRNIIIYITVPFDVIHAHTTFLEKLENYEDIGGLLKFNICPISIP